PVLASPWLAPSRPWHGTWSCGPHRTLAGNPRLGHESSSLTDGLSFFRAHAMGSHQSMLLPLAVYHLKLSRRVRSLSAGGFPGEFPRGQGTSKTPTQERFSHAHACRRERTLLRSEHGAVPGSSEHRRAPAGPGRGRYRQDP